MTWLRRDMWKWKMAMFQMLEKTQTMMTPQIPKLTLRATTWPPSTDS
jgi:hypothetical protein